MEEQYRECAECAAKPGAPDLCEVCLHNRALVERLYAQIQGFHVIAERASEAAESWQAWAFELFAEKRARENYK